MSSSAGRPAHPGRPRLRLRGAEPPGRVHRHVHQPVRRHRRAAPARGHRRRRPAAAAGARLAADLVRVAPGDAGAGPGLRGHRGRPARHRAVRQAPGRVRHRHPRQRPGRADGRARPPAVRRGRPRHRHADRLRPGRGSPGAASTAWSSPRPPIPGVSPSPPLFVPPPLNARLWHLAVQPARRRGERSSSSGDGRTSSSAPSSTPRPGRTSCPTTPSGTTSTRSPPTPKPCAAASSSTARSPRPSRRTSSARPGG